MSIGELAGRLRFFLELSDQKVTRELVESLLQLAEPRKKKQKQKQTGVNNEALGLFGMARNSEAVGPAPAVATHPVQDFQPAQSNATLFNIQTPELVNRSVGSVNSLERSTSPKPAPPLLDTDPALELARGYFESASKPTEGSTANLPYPKPTPPYFAGSYAAAVKPWPSESSTTLTSSQIVPRNAESSDLAKTVHTSETEMPAPS